MILGAAAVGTFLAVRYVMARPALRAAIAGRLKAFTVAAPDTSGVLGIDPLSPGSGPGPETWTG